VATSSAANKLVVQAFVLVLKSGERPAIGQFQPALGSLQSLNVRLLIHAQHQRIFGRIQIQTYHIGSLLGEAGVGRNAPASASFKRNPMLAQHPPNLIVGNVFEGRGQQGAVPAGKALGWRLVQLFEDPLVGLQVIGRRLARPRCILQSPQTAGQKPSSPFAGCGRASLHVGRNLFVTGPTGRAQDDPRPKYIPLGAGRAPFHRLQLRPLFRREYNASSLHALHYTQFAYLCN
jgi:hypothetical protein